MSSVGGSQFRNAADDRCHDGAMASQRTTPLPTVSAAGVLAVGTSVANVLGYALTVVGARRLGPAEFGAFSALLAVVIVGNVAALAVQAATARTVARGPESGSGPAVASAVRTAVVVGVAVGGLLAAASPALRALLDLPSVLPVVAAAVAVAALTITAPALGVAQGHERFARLAWLVAVQAALRVGGGIVAMIVSPTATAGMIGIASGFVVAALVAWVVAHPPWRGAQDGRQALRDTLESAALFLGFVVLTNIDVVLARHVLPSAESGLYAAGAIFAKVAFWLPQFVPMLAFPALTDPGRRRGAINRGLIAVTACGAVLVGLAAATGATAVRIVAGAKYVDLAPWVAGFVALGALYAVVNLLVYAHLAQAERWTVVVVWAVLAVFVVVVETTARTVTGVLVPGLVAAAVLVAWGVVRERRTAHVVTSAITGGSGGSG